VSAYVGSSKNLKDLKDAAPLSVLRLRESLAGFEEKMFEICASLIRNNPPLGPYSRPMSRALCWSYGGGLFRMSEVLI